ncbi:MAG: TetR/AcrR family transcriptional regulator [Alphaproteobacteria bacterium]|nr:TetR/AcrR family transcriptional regulator [Alphaproteobacteria bacterium]MCB9695427.1 TetR/AcrR family transcriptional regulator [Alphaproteobacteria bacterium]
MSASERPNRRERAREQHRREILEAARRVVEARGLSGLTIEEVAKEAEFAVGSIYRHFRSKEELMELLVVHLAEPLADELTELVAAGGRFEDLLPAVAETTFGHLREDLPLLQAFHASAGSLPLPSTSVGARMADARERFVVAMEAVIALGQAQGVLPPGEPRPMTLALVGLISGLNRWATYGFPPGDVEPAALVVRTFLDGWRLRSPTGSR